VHCPGAHAFFDREPFDLERFSIAGVKIALGTDSLAGNASLDMGGEVARMLGAHPSLSPEAVFEMATRSSAAALGFADEVGALVEGAFADMALHVGEGDALEVLTSGESEVTRVWVGGAEVSSYK